MTYAPDPEEPIDRWFQFDYSDSTENVSGLLLEHNLGENGRWIYDPYCGAGSSLLAAVRLGRKAMGNDLDPLAVAASGLKLKARAESIPAEVLGQFVSLARERIPGFIGLSMFIELIQKDIELENRSIESSLLPAWRLATGPATIAPDLLMAGFSERSVDLYTSPPYVVPGSADPIAAYSRDSRLKSLARIFADTCTSQDFPSDDLATQGLQSVQVGPVRAVIKAIDAMPPDLLNRFCVAFENPVGFERVQDRLVEELQKRGLEVEGLFLSSCQDEEIEGLASRGTIVGQRI